MSLSLHLKQPLAHMPTVPDGLCRGSLRRRPRKIPGMLQVWTVQVAVHLECWQLLVDLARGPRFSNDAREIGLQFKRVVVGSSRLPDPVDESSLRVRDKRFRGTGGPKGESRYFFVRMPRVSVHCGVRRVRVDRIVREKDL